MKLKKIFTILLILFVFCLTINQISAIDTDFNDIYSSSATNFTDLQKDINQYDEIKLTHNVTENYGEYADFQNGLKINKTVTIDGDGFTIDAFNLGRIFNIESSGTLILKNVYLINAECDKEGVVIYNQGENSQFINCIFLNNENSNISNYESGLFYNNAANCIIDNCNFGKSFTISILNEGDNLTIKNNKFDNYYNHIGIYLKKGSSYLQNNTFNYNHTTVPNIQSGYHEKDDWSGSLTYYHGLILSNIKIIFVQNKTNTIYQGAKYRFEMYLLDDMGNTIFDEKTYITDLTFKETEEDHVKIIGNHGYVDYKAYDIVQYNNISVEIEDFTNVSAQNVSLSVIDNPTVNSFFALYKLINNTSNGDTIILDKNYIMQGLDVDGIFYDDYIIIDKIITIDGNNHFLNANLKGGFFYVTEDCSLIMKNMNLINGSGSIYSEDWNTYYTGPIFIKSDNCQFINCNFSNNHVFKPSLTIIDSKGEGGVIYFSAKNMSIINCIFNDNLALNGGVIYCDAWGPDNLNIVNSKFYNNTAILSGGVIFNACDNFIITNCSFYNNSALTLGGVIHNNGHDIKINNSVFVSNKAGQGGVIDNINFWQKSVEILNSNFTGNYALNEGGVIYNYKVTILNVTNCNFIENYASKGGVICMNGGDEWSDYKCYIINSTFSSNKATITGTGIPTAGAIFSDICMLTIIDSIFFNNSAMVAGAIWQHSINKNFTLINSSFIDNNALTGKSNGILANASGFTVQNNTFSNNDVQGIDIIGNNCILTIYVNNQTEFLSRFDTENNLSAIMKDDQNNTILIKGLVYNVYETSNVIKSIKADGHFNAIISLEKMGNFKISAVYTDVYGMVKSYKLKNNITFNVTNPSYRNLQKYVNKNDTIIFDYDYIYDKEVDNLTVYVDKTIIIDGNGHKMDAKDIAMFFTIGKNGTLILSNINLVNGNNDFAGIINNGILNLNNVKCNIPIYNKGIITSGVKFVVINSDLTTYDSFLVTLKTDNGIPIMVNSLKYSDDQGHNYKSYIYTNGYYINYVPEGITGEVTFNNVTLDKFTNITSEGKLNISKYPTNVVKTPLKNILKVNSIVKNNFNVLKDYSYNFLNHVFKSFNLLMR